MLPVIRVTKDCTIPKKLREDGVIQAAIDREEFDKYPNEYRTGTKKFSFNRSIYGNGFVKRALRRCQHDKCCYCETKFTASYAGDIEHFRPKAYCQQAKGADREYPGYYWLAYDWMNLFFSCAICNSSYKRNLFPLVDLNTRVHDHNSDLGQEAPVLLDPGGAEDPRDHIKFRQEYPVGQTARGCDVINILGLRRSDLLEDRRDMLAQLKHLRNVIRCLSEDQSPGAQQLVEETRDFLNAAVMPSARFSSMAQDLLAEAE